MEETRGRAQIHGEVDAVEDAREITQMMTPELIEQYPARFHDATGRPYIVRIYGEERANGMWEGWLEFAAVEGPAVLRTGRETTQSSREALAFWAAGLELVYLEGALERARRLTEQALARI